MLLLVYSQSQMSCGQEARNTGAELYLNVLLEPSTG
jgi:hypothetical protein